MRIRITMPLKDGKRLKEKVLETAEKVEEDEFAGEEWEAVRTFNASSLYSPLTVCCTPDTCH